MDAVNTYHHGNLREELVRAGVALAREQGADGVVLREVARRTGVSHNAAYRHFADRDALLAEVARAGLMELGEAMRSTLGARGGGDASSRARRRLRGLGRTYVHFALAEPRLFEVAFSGRLADGPADADPLVILGEVLDALVETGGMRADLRPGAGVLCWSAVHGFARLYLDGPLRGVPAADREGDLDRLLDAIERALVLGLH